MHYRSFRRLLCGVLLISLCGILPAQGNDKSGGIDLSKGVLFEVTPHTGFMGSSGVFGLKMAINYTAFSFELAGEQVIGKTSNLYPISLNGVINLTTRGKFIPYGVVGPVLMITVPTTTIGDETVTTAGLNFGGGMKYFINENFGFRLEAKQYFTTIENKRDSIEEVLIFQEIAFGVTFMFR